MNWVEYTAMSRRLAEVRQAEADRQARVRETGVAGQASVEELRQRIAAQRDQMTRLADVLRLPRPSLDGVVRAGSGDVARAIHDGLEAVGQAEREARWAEQRARQPTLFPGMSPRSRNALLYVAAAWLASVLSCGMWMLSPDTADGRVPLSLVPWSLCGLPAVAFFGGYVAIALLGRPRVRSRDDRTIYSARLGGFICFGGMWLVWLMFLVTRLG